MNEIKAGSRTSDYDYGLPANLIAQHPVEPRDSSRLLVLDRKTGNITHGVFRDIAGLIPRGDVLVLNTTRVMRARLLGVRESGAPAEIFLLREQSAGLYEALVHPGGKIKPGRTITVSPELKVEIVSVTDRRTRLVRLITPLDDQEAIERFGHVPLPPYIGRSDDPQDAARYQTVYATEKGSVAAPTAGLHFTPGLLEEIRNKGVRRVDILLHVGAGTFRPVSSDDPAEHVMHEEWFEITPAAAAELNEVRNTGGSIWAVGTTSVRALESSAEARGVIRAMSGNTNIFLRPPYSFRGVDHLITNFHLPRSTLIMLVAAFAGYELTMEAYSVAVKEGYRFYSYGDAMCVI